MKLFIFNDEKSYGILCWRSQRKIALQGLYLKNKNFLEFLEYLIFFWGTSPLSPDQTLHLNKLVNLINIVEYRRSN